MTKMQRIFMSRDVSSLLAGMCLYRGDENVQRVGCVCVAALVKNVDNKKDFRQKDGLRLLVDVVMAYAHNLTVRSAAAAAIGELAWKDKETWRHILTQYGNEISHLAQHAAGLRIWPNHQITRYAHMEHN